MLLSHAIQGFILDRSAGGSSPNTISTHKLFQKKMIAFLGDVEIESIVKDDLRRWLDSLSGMASNSRRNGWCAMRVLFAWYAGEFGTTRPDENIPRPPSSAAPVISLTQDEIKRILSACDKTKKTDRGYSMSRVTAVRDKAIVLLMLDTGLRVSEVSRLLVSDVSIEVGEVGVRPFMSGKKSRRRTVYLGRAARRSLWLYLQRRDDLRPDDPLFVTYKTLRPMNRDELRKLIVNLGVRAGVKVYPHKLRHTFAICYLRNGGDVFTLQRLLGHSDLKMVKYYLDLAKADDESAHRRASPVDNWRL